MPQLLSVWPGRAQIGDTTDTLNRLEGDLTNVQDGNSEASKELSALEREAKELNLTSEQLHRQLDILKNSNFLGEKQRWPCCFHHQHFLLTPNTFIINLLLSSRCIRQHPQLLQQVP